MEPKSSSYEDTTGQKIWRDSMVEESASIMKNDVCETIPRPEEKLVVTSKRLYKIKHATDGSVEKFKAQFVA